MLNIYDYITDSRMFKKFGVDDLLFVEYHCLLEELQEGYWTHCNYLFYILTGKKRWRSLYGSVTGQPGDAFFVKKGAYVAEQFLEEEYCSLTIFLPDHFISSVMQKHGLRNPGPKVDVSEQPIIPLQVDNILYSYFHSVLNYFPLQKPPASHLLRIKFEELIINILSSTQNSPVASYFDQLQQSSKISIREIMECNFPYNMKLEEYARLSGRSLSTFNRDFKKEFATSPSKWLTERRLEHARFLLETTDHSVNEVAFQSGFENPSHFSRVFKKKFGNTPLNYRRTLQH